MAEIKIFDSIRQISAETWGRLFPDEAEGYDYLTAVEEGNIKGFTLRYVTAFEQGKILAAIPAFFTDYYLDTTLQGWGKKFTMIIKRIFPRFLTLKLACLGSPCIESAYIGFAPGVNKEKLLAEMLADFENYAASQNTSLIGVKDIPEFQKELWDKVATKYTLLPGMPAAYLDINFKNMDEYLAGLSYKTRKDMRRKVKEAAEIRIEQRDNVDDVIDIIMDFYQQTRSRSDWQFEELTQAYFQNLLKQMPGRAFCTLYYAGDTLLAANFLIHDHSTLLDKFFCMSAEGRKYNLYFLSWYKNIEYCLANNLTRYNSGQANYENKIKLGSQLSKNTMYFKHRNRILNAVLKLISPLFSADEVH